jgi:hypothetical protein
MSSLTAAIVALLLVSGPAGTPRSNLPLTPDQQLVVAAAIEDTFPRPRHLEAPIVLCLDVQLQEDPIADLVPPPSGAKGKKKKDKGPEVPPSAFRGAPPELLARASRKWRVVVSAPTCRLDPRQAYTLDDARTLARLVVVRLGAHLATGDLRIDWTGGTSAPPGAVQSRDCHAAHGPRGWTVRCGGTWSE